MPTHNPSDETRLKLLDAAMKKHQHRADALLEILHTAQEAFGYLQDEMLMHTARQLKLPPSRVYGVATFYHFFTFTPKGEHSCSVCMGTACYVKGAAVIERTLEAKLGIQPGQTRTDGKASLSIVRCIGTCGLAPLAIFDGQVVGHVTAEAASERVEDWV